MLLESPGSLTMEVCDVPALAAAAKARGLAVLLDNTWATSLGFRALENGADLAIQALTKHVGGHSDLMMGSVTADARMPPRPPQGQPGARPGRRARRLRAGAARPADAWRCGSSARPPAP